MQPHVHTSVVSQWKWAENKNVQLGGIMYIKGGCTIKDNVHLPLHHPDTNLASAILRWLDRIWRMNFQ